MARKDKDTISYTSLPDATPERELDALVAVYAYVLERHASKKKAAEPNGGLNGVKEARDIDPEQRLPRRR